MLPKGTGSNWRQISIPNHSPAIRKRTGLTQMNLGILSLAWEQEWVSKGRLAHADCLTWMRTQSPFSAQTLPIICSSPPAAHNAQARLCFFKLFKVMRVLVGTISLLRLTSFIHLPGGRGLPHKSRDQLNHHSLREAPCPGPCWPRQHATGSPPSQ